MPRNLSPPSSIYSPLKSTRRTHPEPEGLHSHHSSTRSCRWWGPHRVPPKPGLHHPRRIVEQTIAIEDMRFVSDYSHI